MTVKCFASSEATPMLFRILSRDIIPVLPRSTRFLVCCIHFSKAEPVSESCRHPFSIHVRTISAFFPRWSGWTSVQYRRHKSCLPNTLDCLTSKWSAWPAACIVIRYLGSVASFVPHYFLYDSYMMKMSPLACCLVDNLRCCRPRVTTRRYYQSSLYWRTTNCVEKNIFYSWSSTILKWFGGVTVASVLIACITCNAGRSWVIL